MSDCKGPTFDQEFDEWQVYLDKLDAAVGRDNPNPRGLRSLIAMARSELASRQRMIDLDRQRFDALRDDYEKAQVALASTRLAMVEMDRVTRERNEARDKACRAVECLAWHAGVKTGDWRKQHGDRALVGCNVADEEAALFVEFGLATLDAEEGAWLTFAPVGTRASYPGRC